MGENGVFVFPDAAKGAASSIDPNLLLALQNNGGFGNNTRMYLQKWYQELTLMR